MPIQGPFVNALARRVHDSHLRRKRHDRDDRLQNAAVAEAKAKAMADGLTQLSQQMEAGEVLVDLAHSADHKIGIRGVKVTLTMLAATNRRLWQVVHRDGTVAACIPMPMEAVTTEKKTMAISIQVEQSGAGWKVTAGKSIVEWVQGIVQRRPQAPVDWLVKLTPSGPPPAPAGPYPASWQPDPTGRHELRYWDGTRWTEHVSDRGATSQDPLG